MRRLSGIVLIIMMGLLLAACGSDADDEAREGGEINEENEQAIEKAETTSTAESTETEVATAAVESESGTAEAMAATPGASPVGDEATPMMGASPVSGASPVASPVMEASPMADGTPGASPVADGATPVSSTPAAVVSPMSDAEASPEGSPVATIMLNGRVELLGKENVAWVTSDNGCVGLGDNADLSAGHQVVIRDETGEIIGVTTLEASDEDDGCVWTFSSEVPDSDFYAVSIPMKTELVFTHQDIEQNNGEVTIVLR